jgi:PAT family beta-lactamase induction signal transducer AmpG
MHYYSMKKSLSSFIPSKKDLVIKPILSESPASRYLSFSMLYFAQGVPEGLTFFAIPAFLAMNAVSPLVIGTYLAMVSLPWSLKLILAPFMDRYTIPSMGRKRPWVLLGQIGLVLSFMVLSTLKDPLGNISLLMAMGFVISFFGCFQDVATDGMAVDIIPTKEQARANGLMWGSKLIGTSVSLALGTYMINRFGFSKGVLVPAAFTSLLILVPLFFLERKGERRLPWSAGKASDETLKLQPENILQIIRNTYRVVSRYSSVILMAIMTITGFVTAYMEAILPIFTIQELK